MAEINWSLAQTPDYFGGAIKSQQAGQAVRAEQAKAQAYMLYSQNPQAGLQAIMQADPRTGIQLQQQATEQARLAAQDQRQAKLDSAPKFIEGPNGIYALDPMTGTPKLVADFPEKPKGPNWKERTKADGSTEWFDIDAEMGGGQPQAAPQPQPANWLAGVSQAAPDAQVTSGYRSPADNARVGGVPNSRHMSGQAVDLVPRPGETMAQLYTRVAQAPDVRAINEGDHVHVQQGGAPAGRPVVPGSAPKPQAPRDQWIQLPDGRQRNTLTGKIEGTARGGGDNFRNETTLRKELNSDPAVADFKDVDAAFRQVRALATKPKPSPSDDTALTFSFMKMLDPGSVVREGEFALVGKGAGLPDRVVAGLAMVDQGKVLPASIRADLVSAAQQLHTTRQATYNEVVGGYRQIAQESGLRPDQVTMGLMGYGQQATQRGGGGGGSKDARAKYGLPFYPSGPQAGALDGMRRNVRVQLGSAPVNPVVLNPANPEAAFSRLRKGQFFLGPDGQVRVK